MHSCWILQSRWLCTVLFVLLPLGNGIYGKDFHETINILMPEIQPEKDDQYLCTSKAMNEGSIKYITRFKPEVDKEHVHHMLVYVCERPGSDNDVWECEWNMEPSNRSSRSNYESGPICENSKETVIYAWGNNADGIDMPDDVGFEVGRGSRSYIVIQLHYKNVDDYRNDDGKWMKSHSDSLGLDTLTDKSGLSFDVQSRRPAKLAGVYLMLLNGVIPSQSSKYLEGACKYSARTTIHPFKYRVHGHDKAKVISAYRVRDNEWTEIGRRSPSMAQIFSPVTNVIEVRSNDSLAFRCTMINPTKKEVNIGFGMEDEMCNFYMMYWINSGDRQLNERESLCFSERRWSDLFDTENIPNTASMIPGKYNAIEEGQLPELEDMTPEERDLLSLGDSNSHHHHH